jgi:epoxide hydrolase-like predicted phosphatase
MLRAMSVASVAPRAVLFDLGGVVLGSPFPAISQLEKELGAPAGCITRAILEGGEQGAFQQLERGEIDVMEFAARFGAQCAPLGVPVDGAGLVAAITGAMIVRPAYLQAIRRIRGHGLLAAALTNNWKGEAATSALAEHFDIFLESCRLGMRKPEPRIYRHACEQLGVSPREVVYLDDIGGNLKPARELGMRTIRVLEPAEALRELEQILEFSLG